MKIVILFVSCKFILNHRYSFRFNHFSLADIVLQIDAQIYWVSGSNGSIPGGAILSGSDVGGVPLYTCRAWLNSDLIPGKLTTVNGACNIAYNGQEVKIANYDAAVGHGTFVATVGTNFQLSITSIEGGIVSSQDKLLYVCRASIDGNLSVGKLEDTQCWIGYGGGQQSFAFGQYDVLTGPNFYDVIPI